MRIGRWHLARKRSGTATVSIHVRDLAQFFNALDPSPFWDRDLDRAAAEFIEEEFREKQAADAWHLHVHTREGAPSDASSAADLQQAVERYYHRMALSAERDLREQRRLGRLALMGGFTVFAVCMSLRELLGRLMEGPPRMLDEGLIILAWIALWRPAEALVYDWVPLHRKRRLYERLARIRVQVRPLRHGTNDGASTGNVQAPPDPHSTR